MDGVLATLAARTPGDRSHLTAESPPDLPRLQVVGRERVKQPPVSRTDTCMTCGLSSYRLGDEPSILLCSWKLSSTAESPSLCFRDRWVAGYRAVDTVSL